MIKEIDYWRAANLLIEKHGENAELFAAQKADEMIERGDAKGETAWKRILAAIGELRKDKPGAGGTRH